MKTIPSLPEPDRCSLRLPQIRVMRALHEAAGPLTRARLSERIGNKTNVVVGRAVGYSDPEKRAAFEQTQDGGGAPGKPCPSLLTLGYVEEVELDIDGLIETVVRLTDAGIKAFKDLKLAEVELPPLRD